MNENIDLTKILEGCPKGIKFYSSVYGEVSFEGIENISIIDKYPIKLKAYNKCTENLADLCYTKDGRCFYNYDAECTLFPSKDQRDWSKFEQFWKPKAEKFDPKALQSFDKVLARSRTCDCWNALIFSHMDFKHKAVCCEFSWEECIPYNEETKYLVGTNEDCPEYYKWWEV